MSLRTLTLPRLGETMEEGRVVAWLVAPGAAFARGAALVEVETDKTVVEVPALGPGRLAEPLAAEGETVRVGDALARVEIEGDDWTEGAGAAVDSAEDGATGAGAGAVDPGGGAGAIGRGATLGASGARGDAGGPGAPYPAGKDGETVVVDLPMPRLGETMERGVLAGWLVAPGAAFRRGEALLEIETDKTVAEFPALATGTLVEVLAQEGETVAVGAPIARVAVAPADAATMAGEAAPGKAAAPARAAEPGGDERTAPAATAMEAASPHRAAARPRATPVARRLARRHGLDIAALRGTGRRGRVERQDVARAAAAPARSHGIFLHEAGPATGTPVLLLHGFAADHSIWAGLTARLARAGRRVLAADLPGHGATAQEAATPDDLATGLDAAISARTGQTPLHLVAHSMGAIPTVALAGHLPVASLTLIAPVGLSLGIDRDFLAGLAEAGSPGEVSHLLSRMAEGPLPLSAEAIAEIRRGLATGRLRQLARALAGPAGQTTDLRAPLAALAERLPVQLILGHRDRIVPWQDSVAVSPRIAVHHLPRAGHMPHWDAPAEVLAILTDITEDR